MLSIPLQPSLFPPPSTSQHDLVAPFPTTSAAPSPPPPSSTSHRPHRHTKALKNAVELLRTLSDQAVTPAAPSEDEVESREEGIIANLSTHGWTHQTTKNGVRIFQLETEIDSFLLSPQPVYSETTNRRSSILERQKGVASPRSVITSPGIGVGQSRRGVRAGEELPFFRGEGWIEGSWRKEDVAATISSFGARSVWDPRFDVTHSRVVELLNDTDTLFHMNMHIRGIVADRDACMCNTHTFDDREGMENVLYVAGCSVEDPLVPRGGTRTTVHLNGFAIRSLPREPHFEPPPPPQVATNESTTLDLPPTRPSHRRTKSSMSVILAGNANNTFLSPHPPLPSSNPFNSFSAPLHAPPPPPPPLLQTMSSSTLATSSNAASGPSESAFPFPLTFQSSAEPADVRRGSIPPISSNRPGLAVSMLIRASPGYNLPHSTIEQLSVHLPLSIAAIGRFLSTHGFAPHLVRQGSKAKLREEEFDAATGRYRVVFTVPLSSDLDEKIRIRFYGGTFAGGRFDAEVKHVRQDGWTLEYDVPPKNEDDVLFEKSEEELGGEGSGRWSSSLSVQGFKLNDGRHRYQQRTRFEESPSLSSPGETNVNDTHSDPALLPGPLGGCTLVIDPTSISPELPVIVSITRPYADLSSQPLVKMRNMSKALAQASQVALDDTSTMGDSLEEFLASGREGDEQAEMRLKGARTVLRELRRAKEEEADRASTRMSSSALFGGGGWRSTSPRSPVRPPLASPRWGLGRPASSLSLRFGNS